MRFFLTDILNVLPSLFHPDRISLELKQKLYGLVEQTILPDPKFQSFLKYAANIAQDNDEKYLNIDVNEFKSNEVNDYFETCGRNLRISGEKSVYVTCVRLNKIAIHSALGKHVVKKGKMEWIICIEKGEQCDSIRIGVCGSIKIPKKSIIHTNTIWIWFL
eukprot:204213_1